MRKGSKIAAMASCFSLFLSAPTQSETISVYGTPGLIDMPTAEVMNDGNLAFSVSHFGPTTRGTMAFQVFPWLTGSFRYNRIEGLTTTGSPLFDRNFDVHIQIAQEKNGRPALAFGLRDFGGTGVFSSEYVVATKTLSPGLKFTGGIGWGRLGGRNSFDNPLGIFSSRFDTRPGGFAGPGGQLETDTWFRGDAAFFGGVSWQVNERLTFKAEYSSDVYPAETIVGEIDLDTPINIGVDYRFKNGIQLGAFLHGGTELGFQFTRVIDPRKTKVPGGLETSAAALLPRDSLAAASWNLPESTAAKGTPEGVLQARLEQEGISLEGAVIGSRSATIRVRNNRWGAEAQAAGRAARVMANTLAPEVEKFTIVFQENGVPITKITTNRSDLYELENDYDGPWRTFARADIEDASGVGREGEFGNAFPQFEWGLTPFTRFSYFDPDRPLRYEFGPELNLVFRPSPGLTFATKLTYPISGDIDSGRGSNSLLPRVRSNGVLYAQQSDLEVNVMTAEYMFRPGKDLFGRVTAGYLESMFGGVSGELLWYPVDSRLALGAEVNWAQQRDFDILFGFQNYDVVTGHVSAYYDFGGGFLGQVDAGRYLAGDWGATMTVTREFDNGFRVGGFFTLTDVPFSTFGEGSFDKGITLEIPVAWMTGRPSKKTLAQTIRPTTRDGGARLEVNNRLFGLTRDYRANELEDGWGRYLR